MQKNTKPVILQILPALETGGVERGTLEISKALVDKGWTSIVVSAGGRLVPRLELNKGKHITLPVNSKNPFVIWRNSKRLARIIKEHHVSLVHARSRAPAWSAYWAAKKKKIPFITTFHGTYGLKGPGKKRYNTVMTKGKKIIAISDFIADHIQQNYDVKKDKIEVIHRGVDVDIFNIEKVPADRVITLANKWQLPDGVFVVMLPGRLTGWKGQTVMLEALSHLKDLNIFCVLLGPAKSDRFRDKLMSVIEDKKLEGFVRIIDGCDDMPAAYMLADVVVSASTDPEAFGRVVAEAQAMEKVVVATNHGGATETVLEGKTGWLIPPKNAKILAEKIREIFNMKVDKRKKMGETARAHIKKSFTMSEMCAKTLKIYKEILKI